MYFFCFWCPKMFGCVVGCPADDVRNAAMAYVVLHFKYHQRTIPSLQMFEHTFNAFLIHKFRVYIFCESLTAFCTQLLLGSLSCCGCDLGRTRRQICMGSNLRLHFVVLYVLKRIKWPHVGRRRHLCSKQYVAFDVGSRRAAHTIVYLCTSTIVSLMWVGARLCLGIRVDYMDSAATAVKRLSFGLWGCCTVATLPWHHIYTIIDGVGDRECAWFCYCEFAYVCIWKNALWWTLLPHVFVILRIERRWLREPRTFRCMRLL